MITPVCAGGERYGETLVAACDDGVIRVLGGEDLSDVALLPCPGFVRDIDVSAGRLLAALSYIAGSVYGIWYPRRVCVNRLVA